MSDLIALARRHKHVAPTHYEGCEADHIGCLVNRLADEIEKQREDNERLRSQVEAVNPLKAEITILRKALEPLAQHYLWPDDLGEDFASLIRSDDDWSEEVNEDADSDVFIKRKYIRAARHALEGK